MLFKKMLGSIVNESIFNQDLRMLTDGYYEITPFKFTRSNLQNRYLRGWIYTPIAEYSGNTPEEVHSIMGIQFLKAKTSSWKADYIRSTTTLTTAEFAEYTEKIRNWMTTFGLYLPTPEERKQANGLLDDNPQNER